ncbi:hypothetical protein C9I56_35035 [Paraburkholderia caribensis]|nr:hypothetical protein C9I56_35035 [Paraburkholderia caribensis]
MSDSAARSASSQQEARDCFEYCRESETSDQIDPTGRDAERGQRAGHGVADGSGAGGVGAVLRCFLTLHLCCFGIDCIQPRREGRSLDPETRALLGAAALGHTGQSGHAEARSAAMTAALRPTGVTAGTAAARASPTCF